MTQINGSVRGDGSRYDDELYVPEGWGADVAGIEAGPYDALLVNDARVQGDDQRASDPNEAGGPRVRADPRRAGDHRHRRRRDRHGPGRRRPMLATVDSQPIAAAIAEMLTNSDNNTAELMLKEIGFAASGAGTRQAGIDAVTATIGGWGDRHHRAS